MQGDEYNYQSDKQFTDKAWANMHELLDKEMPVEKKKRRGFIWFFLLLGLGIFGAIWMLYPNAKEVPLVNEKTKSTSVPTEKIPFTQSQIKNIDEKNNTNEALKTDQNSTIHKTEIRDTKTNFSKKGNQKKPIIADANRLDFSNKTSETNQNSLGKNTERNISNTVSNELQNRKEKNNNNTFTKSTSREDVIELEKISPSFFTLKLLESEEKVIGLDVSKLEEKPIVESLDPPQRKVEVGLYGGALLDFSNNKIGGFGGSAVHFSLDEKVGLQTGLGYTMLSKDLNYNFRSSQEALLDVDPVTISNPAQERAVVESRTELTLTKMHYLEVPLLLTYAPIEEIQIQLGLSGAFLIQDQIEVVSDNLQLSSDFSGVGLDELVADSYSQEPYREELLWNRWDMSSVIGLAWRPTPKWSIGIQYHYGWRNILETNEAGVKEGQFDNNGGYSVTTESIDLGSNAAFPVRGSDSQSQNYNRSLRLMVGYKF